MLRMELRYAPSSSLVKGLPVIVRCCRFGSLRIALGMVYRPQELSSKHVKCLLNAQSPGVTSPSSVSAILIDASLGMASRDLDRPHQALTVYPDVHTNEMC